MSQRILVFENDAAFAGEVKSNFERMGLLVDVASDGPSGLELASVHRPDLILLTIELPGMNGFLVCKKIKKTSELESVPLVILSSEVDQETFEQHKKLRTRADEYIRKPIAFADLLSRVQSFVPANANDLNVADAAEETALDIEEAFSVGDDDVIVLADDDTADDAYIAEESIPPDVEPEPALHHEAIQVEALHLEATQPEAKQSEAKQPETMIDGLEAADASDVTHPSVVPPPLTPELSLATIEANSSPAYEMPVPAAREPVVAPRLVVPNNSFRAQPLAAEAAPSADLERMKRELGAADEKVSAAEKRASLAEQRASSAERALDSAKRTGGASSRELLDLREQQNRKERELLELREQVTARDKQVIEASDRSLAVERDLQDARDKCSDLQREVEKKTEIVAALTADKDSVRKRLDDTKARAERSEAKVKELGTELDGLKARHHAELDEVRVHSAQAEASLRSAHAEAERARQAEQALVAAALRAEHAGEVERTKREHTQEVERLTQQHAGEVERSKNNHASALETLQREHAGVLAAKARAHSDELSELREEHAVSNKSTNERAEQEKLTALDALRHELVSVHQERQTDAANAHRAELASVRSDWETRHNSEVSALSEKHRQELARLGKLLSEAESRHALLEERHEETESARATAETQLRSMAEERDQQNMRNSELSVSLERARAKSARDEEILERVRKAMAIGLGLLEEQKHTGES